MPEADRELMEAALRQLEGKLDYTRLAKDLNMNSSKSAWTRWSRFKTRLNKTTSSSSTTANEPMISPQAPSEPKTPDRKRKAGNSRTPAKRRRAISGEDEDEPTKDIKTENDISVNQAGFQTPSRRLPARKSRVTTFKEESDTEFSDVGFAGSGRGGTPMEDSDAVVTHYDEYEA